MRIALVYARLRDRIAARPQHRDAPGRQRRELRPQHVEADALQEHAADDDQEVPQRNDRRHPLDDRGMFSIGKMKPDR